MKIGFVGLGKLGLPSAYAIASKDHEVIGYDIDLNVETYIKEKWIPYKEHLMDLYMKEYSVEFRPLKNVVIESEILFVAVQTPHNEKYEGITRLPNERVDFDYTYLINSIQEIVDIVIDYDLTDVIVSIISTVLPGTVEEKIKPILSRAAGKINLVYNPFFIAMGNTIYDFLKPEFVLIGVDSRTAAEKLADFYETITDAPQYECSIESAEAIKVLYNTYITGKICFINAAMELCHHTGANVDSVTEALSMAGRRIISPAYMQAGMGDGGGCHPRDNIALSFISRKHGISFDWWENLMIAREKQTEWLADIILKYVHETNYPLIMLGMSFKPGTNLTVGSPALLLKNILLEKYPEINMIMLDPHVDSTEEYNRKLSLINSGPQLYFISTNHDEWHTFKWMKDSIIIDPWGYIQEATAKLANVIHLGR